MENNERLGISDSIGITAEDYKRSMGVLLDYLQGNRDDIEVLIMYRGGERETFNEKEKQHMVDVRNLYGNAKFFCFFAIGIFLLLFAILYYDDKTVFFEILSISFLRVSILFLALLTFLSLYAWIDFSDFWTKFHQLFFTNDLWLLDAQTDIMIQMLPEAVFFALVLRIVATFVGLYSLLLLLSGWYLKKRKKLYMVLFS